MRYGIIVDINDVVAGSRIVVKCAKGKYLHFCIHHVVPTDHWHALLEPENR
jgi:hypothetical protein